MGTKMLTSVKHAFIEFGGFETNMDESFHEVLVPYPPSLFLSIKLFLEEQHVGFPVAKLGLNLLRQHHVQVKFDVGLWIFKHKVDLL